MTIRSNLVGCNTGNEAGIVPDRTLPGIDAGLSIPIDQTGAVAHLAKSLPPYRQEDLKNPAFRFADSGAFAR
jgi:hypothetical protein